MSYAAFINRHRVALPRMRIMALRFPEGSTERTRRDDNIFGIESMLDPEPRWFVATPLNFLDICEADAIGWDQPEHKED
jgi:hypothetical protein